jgi:hypothetical protein
MLSWLAKCLTRGIFALKATKDLAAGWSCLPRRQPVGAGWSAFIGQAVRDARIGPTETAYSSGRRRNFAAPRFRR